MIIDTNFPISPEYPAIYQVAQYCLYITGIGGALGHLALYFHMLFRLKFFCNENEYIKKAVPCECCFYFIGFAILLLPVGFWGIYRTDQWAFHKYNPRPKIAVLIACDAVFINVSLLYYYVKGLHIYAEKYYFPKVTMENVDGDRIHELLLEATSYVVLFGMLILTDVAALIVVLMLWNLGDECSIFSYLAEIGAGFEIIMTILSIYLSLPFGHTTYRKCCKYPHDCMNALCVKWIRRRYQRILLNQGVLVDDVYHRI